MSGAGRPVPGTPPPPARRASAGFTLLELMFAFAILAVVMAGLAGAETSSRAKAQKAVELRELRVMADTVFRRIVYEHGRWEDGQRGQADEWYADFAMIPPGPLRERWKQYRLELRKRKGLIAGTDPSGQLESLVDGGSASGASGSGSGTGTGTAPPPTSGTAESTASGEAAWLVELSVYLADREEPEIVLRSILPLSDEERRESLGAAK